MRGEGDASGSVPGSWWTLDVDGGWWRVNGYWSPKKNSKFKINIGIAPNNPIMTHSSSAHRRDGYNNLPMNHLCRVCHRGVDDWGLGSSSCYGSHHGG